MTNSRLQKRSNSVWRRRRCSVCKAIFTTIENPNYSTSVIVVSNKTTLPFSPEKLFLSVYDSLKHRPRAIDDTKYICETVTRKMIDSLNGGQISASSIRNLIMITLNRFDKTAAVHYQAFHPNN